MQVPVSNEEVLATLKQKVVATEADAFRVRVFRRAVSSIGSTLPETVAVFDDVTLDQLSSVESWLPRLAGGGVYSVRCYHMSNRQEALGRDLAFQVAGEAFQVDPSFVRAPGYTGPRSITWPVPTPVGHGQSIPAQTLPATTTTPQTNVPGVGVSGSGSSYPWAPDYRQQLADKERELAELRHQNELEKMEARQEARLRDIELRATAAARPAKEGPSLMEVVSAFATVVAPVVQTILVGQQKMAEAQLQAQQRQGELQTALLTEMMKRPAVDPVTQKLLDKAISGDSDQPTAKFLTSMAEGMAAVNQAMLGNMKAAMDLNSQGEEPTALKVVRELGKAVSSAMATMGQNAPSEPIRRNRPAALPPAAGRPNGNGQGQVLHSAPGVAEKFPQNVVDHLEAMIRGKVDPEAVVKEFIAALRAKDPSLTAELDRHGRDPVAMFNARLSGWATEQSDNFAYIRDELLPTLGLRLKETYGAALELFGEESHEDDGAEEDEEEEAREEGL